MSHHAKVSIRAKVLLCAKLMPCFSEPLPLLRYVPTKFESFIGPLYNRLKLKMRKISFHLSPDSSFNFLASYLKLSQSDLYRIEKYLLEGSFKCFTKFIFLSYVFFSNHVFLNIARNNSGKLEFSN